MLVAVDKTEVKQIETSCTLVYEVETESMEEAIAWILQGDNEHPKVFPVDKQFHDTKTLQHDIHIGGFRKVT